MAKIVIFSPFFFCVSHRCVCVLALLHVGEGGGGNIISCLLDGKNIRESGLGMEGKQEAADPTTPTVFPQKVE